MVTMLSLKTGIRRTLLVTSWCLLAWAGGMQAPGAAESDSTDNLREEMIWTSLEGRVSSIASQHEILSTLLGQYQVCHNKLKFYSPDSTNPAKDADGCVPPPVPADIEVTTQAYDMPEIDCGTANFTCGDGKGGNCSCKAEDVTAKNTCRKLDHKGFVSYRVGTFKSPNNVFIAYWDPSTTTFVRASANSQGNRLIYDIVCYSLSQ